MALFLICHFLTKYLYDIYTKRTFVNVGIFCLSATHVSMRQPKSARLWQTVKSNMLPELESTGLNWFHSCDCTKSMFAPGKRSTATTVAKYLAPCRQQAQMLVAATARLTVAPLPIFWQSKVPAKKKPDFERADVWVTRSIACLHVLVYVCYALVDVLSFQYDTLIIDHKIGLGGSLPLDFRFCLVTHRLHTGHTLDIEVCSHAISVLSCDVVKSVMVN